MSDILKGEKGLIGIRIVDDMIIHTGTGEDGRERVDVPNKRIGHFAIHNWSVRKKYELTYAPEKGDFVIRVVDDEIVNTYDPFDFSTAPEIKGKSMVEELVAIGEGDKPPPRKDSTKTKRILNWVSTFGLLENESVGDPSGTAPVISTGGQRKVRQKEISLEEFWLFAKDVRGVLAMAYNIRQGKIDKIDERAQELRDNPTGRRLSDFEEYLVRWADRTTFDKKQNKWVFKSSDAGLQLSIRLDVFFMDKLRDLTVGVSGGLFGKDLAVIPQSIPTPGGLHLITGNLKTGIYAEAALVASGAVEVDLCQRDGCDHLVVKTNSKKRYCSDSCKSMVNQRKQNGQTP